MMLAAARCGLDRLAGVVDTSVFVDQPVYARSSVVWKPERIVRTPRAIAPVELEIRCALAAPAAASDFVDHPALPVT